MDDAKLIAAVRGQNVLYDLYATDYYNQMIREKIWEEIALLLGTTAKRCKTRWSYLRDLYTKAQKNRKAKRMEGGSVMKPWRYEFEMSFLDPFLLKQKQGPCVPRKIRKLSRSVEIPVPEENMPEITPAIVSPPSTPLPRVSSPSSIENLTDTQKRLQITSSTAIVQNHPNNKVASSSDALTKYFEAVAETVRGFSPTLQVKVKSEISKIVHQAEMENIQQSQFEPFIQSTQNYSVETQANAQYSFECAVTKQEQPG